MSRRAFLVLGPESSGTRLATRIMCAAGCVGDWTHAQRWDAEPLPDRGENIVWRRSLPHNLGWPPIGEMVQRLRAGGFHVDAIVTQRATHPMACSQLQNGYVRSIDDAHHNIRHAYAYIWQALTASGVRGYPWVYEALVAGEHLERNELMAQLGLEGPFSHVPIHDGNAKYYPKGDA